MHALTLTEDSALSLTEDFGLSLSDGDASTTPTISVSATNLLNTQPTVAVTGTNNVWLSVPPTFTLSAGTIDTLNVTGDNACTFRLASGAGTAQDITDTTTGATDTIGVAAATAYTVTPSGTISGTINVPYEFTFQANGLTTAVITTATDGTGAWDGNVTLDDTNEVTAEYTGTSTADSPHTLSFTSSLTDPSNITFTVSPQSALIGVWTGVLQISAR